MKVDLDIEHLVEIAHSPVRGQVAAQRGGDRVTPADLLPGEVAVLRTCAADGTSHGGFIWPTEVGATVEAPDWSPDSECGRGLHGLLRGCGDGSLLSWADDALWMVVAVDLAGIVDLEGKVKFRRGRILHAGTRESATTLLRALYPDAAIVGGTATAGDGGTATAGYGGTATAGDGGTATAGDGGTATAGYRGTATAGYRGTATAGYRGTATAGEGGTATAGYGGTATAGYRGTIAIRYWDGDRYRILAADVGDGGIDPGVAYRVSDGKLVRAEVIK